MPAVLAAADPSARNLLAFPAQSNFSGVQHPLDLVDEAHAAGWDVLVDAGRVRADQPARRRPGPARLRDALVLQDVRLPDRGRLPADAARPARRPARPWFAGGTITIASVQGDGHYLHDDEAAFEDGTVDYLNLPAVATGLRHLERIGRDAIHDRVCRLTGWLLDALAGLRHANGRRSCRSTDRPTPPSAAAR